MNFEIESQLRYLINLDPTKLVFLCGAGISLDKPTLLPTVNVLICDLLKQCGVSDKVILKLKQKFGKTTYRFESLIDEIHKKCDTDLLIAKLFESNSYNLVHSFLGEMLKKGSSIITTNFDNCIENSCDGDFFINPNKRIVYTGEDLDTSDNPLSGMLIKIHGSNPLVNENNAELVITIKALAKTERAFMFFPKLKKYLLSLMKDKIIIVMGYSCSDDFDIVPLLEEANPQDIVWLNYNNEYEFPKITNRIDNTKILRLSQKTHITYFDGQLQPYLKYWADKEKISLKEGMPEKRFTVSDYIKRICTNNVERKILCNEILLSYELYEEILNDEPNEIMKMQRIKAEFRLGNYKEVIKLCRQIENNKESNVKGENLYYFASALYYEKDYLEALRISQECITYSKQVKDNLLYLHAMINYASIRYVYATILKKGEKRELRKVEKIYNEVLEKSVGLSLEAKANALWGLGDLELYRGNVIHSKNMLYSALEILENIGNRYAIDQLLKIIKNIDEFHNP